MEKLTSWSGWEYLWPYASRRYTLRTSMTPEQCWEQLKIHVAPEPGGRGCDLDPGDNLVGWFHPPSFTIRRAGGLSRTPCPTVAYGRLTRTETGSRLTVRVAMDELGLILVSLWLVLWVVFLLVFSHLTPLSPSGGPPFPLLCAVWFVGYAILVWSRRSGRGDGWIMIRALCEILKAEEDLPPVPTNPPSSIRSGTGRSW
jgi:hypothetical protein